MLNINTLGKHFSLSAPLGKDDSSKDADKTRKSRKTSALKKKTTPDRDVKHLVLFISLENRKLLLNL